MVSITVRFSTCSRHADHRLSGAAARQPGRVVEAGLMQNALPTPTTRCGVEQAVRVLIGRPRFTRYLAFVGGTPAALGILHVATASAPWRTG